MSGLLLWQNKCVGSGRSRRKNRFPRLKGARGVHSTWRKGEWKKRIMALKSEKSAEWESGKKWGRERFDAEFKREKSNEKGEVVKKGEWGRRGRTEGGKEV